MQRLFAGARLWLDRSRSDLAGGGTAHLETGDPRASLCRRVLEGGGQIRALLRGAERLETSAGAPESWPLGLLGAMRICLESPAPAWLYWGEHPTFLYNDAAIVLLGGSHPRVFGAPAPESKAEIWEISAPWVDEVLASGRPRHLGGQLLLLPCKNNALEERYFEIELGPILEDGYVAGVLCTAACVTNDVRAARRRDTLAEVTARTSASREEQEVWRGAVTALERNPADIPYAVLYGVDAHGAAPRLTAALGVPAGGARAPARIEPDGPNAIWPLARAEATPEPLLWADALICPIRRHGVSYGHFVAGLNRRQPIDAAYRSFLTSIAERLAAPLANIRCRDEQARREEVLEQRRRRLEQRCTELMQLFEHAPIPIIVVRGMSFVLELANAAALALSPGRDLLGKPLFEAAPELAAQGFDARLRRVLETGVPDVGREVKVRLEHEGCIDEKHFTFIGAPLQDKSGGEARIIVVAYDDTEQVRAREALEASEVRYRSIFDNVDVSIWEADVSGVVPLLEELSAAGVKDLRGYIDRHPEFLPRALSAVSIVDVNDATLRLFGTQEKEELTRSLSKLFLPESWQTFAETLVAMAEKPQMQTHTAARTLDGRRRELMLTAAFSGRGARADKALITLTDITEHKRLEQALREADRQKDEFLATLAHELRNPLAPLRSSVDLLRTAPERASEMIAVIERQVEHLTRLANDLVESSRIRRGTYDLRKQRVRLGDVLRDALDTAESWIRAAGHDLEVTIPDEPLWLDADPTRLAQIFTNLLNNASRYTRQPGRIIVQAKRDGDHAEVGITDTGIGIPAEALPRLFTMFGRLGGDEEPSVPGLGIGLALAKQLAEMHGGTIQARSAGPGKGSTFAVRLPLAGAAGDHDAEPPPSGDSIAGRRVLVVEDNVDAAESLSMILEACGAEVRVATNGPKALASFASFCPDVVLLDIGLPGMSGYEVARRLRAEFASRPALIVALTGWGREEDVKRAGDAGFDAHLIKPVHVSSLQRLLARPSPQSVRRIG